MSTRSKTIAALVAAGVVFPAMAGPDFQAIERAREAKQAQRTALQTGAERAAMRCDQRLVLPLDHGPRAVTTPHLNAQRKARFEAQQRQCERQGNRPPSG